jgi:hypothetical protein
MEEEKVVYTNFQTPLFVKDVRTSLRATYLMLNDDTTVRLPDGILKTLKGLSLPDERMP